MPGKAIEKAHKIEHRVKRIHELPIQQWVLGYKLVLDLKDSDFVHTFFDPEEETLLGYPYVVDCKNEYTLLIATSGDL